MDQVSRIEYLPARLAVLTFFILAFSLTAFSQTKPLEEAQAEAAGTPDIVIAYDENRYLTIARLTVDSIADNEPLKKSARKFEWTLESWFSVKGIDSNPARVVLCADTQSKRFLFQRDSDLTLTFDGEDILLGEGQRTSEFKGKAKENVCWEVDKVIVEEFGSASSASFSVAGLKGEFAADSLSKFKSYYRVLSVK